MPIAALPLLLAGDLRRLPYFPRAVTAALSPRMTPMWCPYLNIGASKNIGIKKFVQEVTSAKLLALVIAFLVPAGLALFYALVLTARYMAHSLVLLWAGPYDGLSSYMLMAAVGVV